MHHVEPAVNRQPGFRRELVEQKPAFIIFVNAPSMWKPSIRHPNTNLFSDVFFKIFRIFMFFGTLSRMDNSFINCYLIEHRSWNSPKISYFETRIHMGAFKWLFSNKNEFPEILQNFENVHHCFTISENTTTGSKSRFDRAPELIFTGNQTQIWYLRI